MEKKIFELLNEIGCPCNVKGRDYIETAIKIVFENKNVQITKELYPKIAKIHNTTPSRVERAIRHAIELCFCNVYKDVLQKVFGHTIDSKSGKIVNGAFIYGIVKYLKVYGENK